MEISSMELKRIMKDYEFSHDMMTEEDERSAKSKAALSLLPQADRIIFTLFADIGSAKKVADIIGISQTLMYRELKRIRAEIKKNYEKINLEEMNYE